jgi:replicative DNA helicase
VELVRKEISDYQAALSCEQKPGGEQITTGISTLDAECGPIGRGELVVIGARPSMGKSSLALQIASRASSMHGPVLIFPIETGAAQVTRNLLAQTSHVSAERLTQRDKLTEAELMNLMRSAQAVCEMKLWIDDTAALTVEQAWGRSAALQAKHGLRLVVVDYLQLLRAPTGSRGRSREQEVSDMSRGLKAMARSLNVPVIACSQISRASEAGEDKRPRLSHLRESGQIEQDADLVILLHRQERYTPEDHACHGWAEAIVAKRKVGRSGGVAKIGFDGTTLRFYDRANDTQPGEENPFARTRADHE